MSSGSVYTGERDYNGLMSGKGSLITPSGATYEGDLLDGHFHGAGALVFPNGARYSARWEAGVEVPGSGSYCWKDGLAYNLPEQPAGEGAAAAAADLARWPYLTPFDRRLWTEHKAGVRADVGYVVETRKQQLSSTTLAVEALPSSAALKAPVVKR